MTVFDYPTNKASDEVLAFPLTFAQQRLWFLYQLEGPSATYNLQKSLQLTGSLNKSALVKAIDDVAVRHEVLRTTIQTIDGKPCQVIADTSSVKLDAIDLQHLPGSERIAAAHKLSAEQRRHSFALDQGVLWRATLIQLSADSYFLLLTIHHIITDAWSMGLLSREIAACYKANVLGERANLPQLEIQYGDFADWQRARLADDVLQAQLRYWQQQLAGIPPSIDLPTDYPRPNVQTYRGASKSLELPAPLSLALKALGNQTNATLFMTLLSAFATLLHRYSGQKDVVIGSPSAGRDRSEIENLIGFFVNTLVLRTSFRDNPSFTDLLIQVREMALEAFTHQAMPFEKLVEVLQHERDLSRSPLFQVWFNMLNIAQESWELPDLEVKAIGSGESASKFDLTMYVVEKEDHIQFRLIYNTDLFRPERMTLLLEQFQALLEQIVQDPSQRVNQFSLLTPADLLKLPDPNEPLQAQPQQGLLHHLSQQSAKRANQLAISDVDQQLTYGELHLLSNQIANGLVSKGIQPEETVVVYAHRSAALVVALLGIWKAGAAFIILDPAYPAARLSDCLAIAQPAGWISLEAAGDVSPEVAPEAQTLKCYFTLPSKLTSSMPAIAASISSCTQSPEVQVTDDSLAYIAFTSGTTGRPKAVLGTYAPLAHFLQWHTTTFAMKSTDRFCLLSGLAHDPILRDIFTPLWLGATLHIPAQTQFEAAGQLAKWMIEARISIAHLTPAMSQLLMLTASSTPVEPVKQAQIDTLRYAFFGGDVLTASVVNSLVEIAPEVTCINFYGTTETPQAMGYFIVPDQAEIKAKSEEKLSYLANKIPIGRGIADTQLLVLNPSGQLAGIGEVGEIYVRSPYLAKGYLHDNRNQPSPFIHNPFSQSSHSSDRLYKTGDLGRYQLEGQVEYLNRCDRQIKLRGFRIEPGEIESTLCMHPQVKSAVVVAIYPDASIHRRSNNPRLAAYVVPYLGQSLKQPSYSLCQYLQQRLPAQCIPSTFTVLETLPLTPNGKLDHQALCQLESAQLSLPHSRVPAKDMLEQQLIKIWENVIDVRPIGIRDNFFELGGHSLLAIQLFAAIEQVFGTRLPLSKLFEGPTVEALAFNLRDRDRPSQFAALTPIQPWGHKTPLICVHDGYGEIYIYRRLAAYLDPDRPVYGLQSPSLDGKTEALTTVEETATAYIKDIKALQPEGPYLLGGFCLGGRIALEIAHQLRECGDIVPLVALFGTPTTQTKEEREKKPSISKRTELLSQLSTPRKSAAYTLDTLYRKLNRLDLWNIFNTNQKKSGNQPIEETQALSSQKLQRSRVYRANCIANRLYQQNSFDGHIVSFWARHDSRFSKNSQSYWAQITSGAFSSVKVNDHTMGTVFKGPNTQRVASILRTHLEGAERTGADAHAVSVHYTNTDEVCSSLVTIRPVETKLQIQQQIRPPLFCIHDGELPYPGEPYYAYDIARHINKTQPVYGLSAFDRGNHSFPPSSSIEDIAVKYLNSICTFHPADDYLLLGVGVGGLVAFEMAQLLRANGKQASFLGIVETPLLALQTRTTLNQSATHFKRKIRARLIRTGDCPAIPDLQYSMVKESLDKARKHYHPKPYPGPLTLFRAQSYAQPYVQCHAKDDSDSCSLSSAPDWNTVVTGPLQIKSVPADHKSLFNYPEIKAFCQQLEISIDRALTQKSQ